MSPHELGGNAAVDKAAWWLREAKAVAVLTGAGVSAESGLPVFRGEGGLWRGHDPLRLATPGAFERDPELVWAFYNDRRARLAEAAPNAGHAALADLQAGREDVRLITQNVDRLHQRAGGVDVIELHGNLDEVRCTRCEQREDRRGEALGDRPSCRFCGAAVRPAVVWFGETLPAAEWGAALVAVTEADVLLVVGTSTVVQPAAGLIGLAREQGATVLEVNLEPSAASAAVDIGIYGPAGVILPALVAAALG